MFSTLIVSQGRLAAELLASARRIVGEVPDLSALSLDWEADGERVQLEIRQAVTAADHGDGVLILVDVYGGTPYNQALRLLCAERSQRGESCGVEVVTGVNLPMVLRVGCLTDRAADLHEAAQWLSGKGQGSICVAHPPTPTDRPPEAPERVEQPAAHYLPRAVASPCD